MSKFVHLIPIGTGKNRLLESLKKCGHPFHKVYLIITKSSEDEYKRIADQIENSLRAIAEVERIYVDAVNIYAIVIELIKITRNEMKEGNIVLINVSDCPGTVSLACYIAAQLSKSKLYIGLPEYRNNEEIGVKEVMELVFPPLKRISNDKLTIIKIIKENGNSVDSINKLIELIEGKIKDAKKYMAQRARMSYHLKKLEDDGLIRMIREGKNVKIILTELGKAYALIANS